MLLSLVIPIYNEAAAFPLLLPELRKVLGGIGCDHEILLINDGSSDGSLEQITAAAREDSRIKVLSFARNFGHQAAITAGIDFTSGDAVVVMDADLQDPPELLTEMVARYREGYDVVSAQRVTRAGDSLFKKTTARFFYWVMRTMVDERIVPEVGDFRLFSRDAVMAIRGFREQHRFMRGLVAWLGLKEAIIPFHRATRSAGETKYPLHKMLRFAYSAIASFSALPLRIATALGLLLCFAGFLYLAYTLYIALVLQIAIPGWTSIVVLQCIFSGMTLLCLGLIGDYVARIFDESKQRPLYVLSKTVNIRVADFATHRAVVLPHCEEPTHFHAKMS
ncbi:MAG TPA: glycosyltransferase family 2 protein [Bryobacteraceae bacterium]|nr:glycosyltransferase family 2 protein [Bryobacteraceae bacterium]